MKYRVLGHTTVTVSCVVSSKEALTEKELFERAKTQFGGIRSYGGNGGDMKLIGMECPNETIAADEAVEFDDYREE